VQTWAEATTRYNGATEWVMRGYESRIRIISGIQYRQLLDSDA
jgi:hypothetical protein